MALARILVPVDYSEPSRAALELAGVLAQAVGASLLVLHGWESPPFVEDVEVVGPNPNRRHPALDELVVARARRELERFVASAPPPVGIHVEHKLSSGSPTRVILDELEQGAYDLVVMGTHRKSAVEAMLIGSVADKVIRDSEVPVLVVPPSDDPATSFE